MPSRSPRGLAADARLARRRSSRAPAASTPADWCRNPSSSSSARGGNEGEGGGWGWVTTVVCWKLYPFFRKNETFDVSYRTCFALHPLASPCFFTQILSESLHLSNIKTVSITIVLLVIGIVSSSIPINIGYYHCLFHL